MVGHKHLPEVTIVRPAVSKTAASECNGNVDRQSAAPVHRRMAPVSSAGRNRPSPRMPPVPAAPASQHHQSTIRAAQVSIAKTTTATTVTATTIVVNASSSAPPRRKAPPTTVVGTVATTTTVTQTSRNRPRAREVPSSSSSPAVAVEEEEEDDDEEEEEEDEDREDDRGTVRAEKEPRLAHRLEVTDATTLALWSLHDRDGRGIVYCGSD